jgi:hypothetical protein
MRFPIDVVFLDRNLRVVRLVERLSPWRAAGVRRARSALELAAGEVAKRRIDVGDVVAITDTHDGFRLADPPAALGAALDRKPEPVTELTAASARVLLITPDRRFRAVAGALFAQRGCTVAFGERVESVAELARLERSEVVVLDATASLTAAAREAAQIEALEPRVAVIMVAEDSADKLAAMLVLPKWDSFDALYGAVDDARARIMRR